MRKVTFFIALMLACMGNFRAQHITHILDSTFAGADTTFFYEESFVELDTSSYLTTTQLWDRAPCNIALDEFTGTNEAPGRVDAGALIQGYLDIRAAHLNETLPDYDSLINLTEVLSVGYDALPITIVDYTLNRIRSDAFTQGYLTFDNGILSTTGTGSPFEEMEVFMAGMLNQTFPLNDTFSIIAPYIGYYGGNGASVNAIRIDFKDGNGWQNLTWNQPMDVYLTGEEGEFDFEIEVSYTGESVKISKNTGVKKSSSSCSIPVIQPEEAPWGGETQTFNFYNRHSIAGPQVQFSITRNIKYHLTSSQGYKGYNGKGKVYVRYRDGAPTPRTFKKPVIIVEGIDFGSAGVSMWAPTFFSYSTANKAVNNFSSTTRLGTFGWPEMFGCNSDEYPNAKMPDFVDSLYDNDNDLILLDFFDGADYIQRNAMLLKELINRINQNKEGDEEIVIIGVSMGGQVARYALADMEANNEDHCVRLFASHDSPWKGANISPSIQFFAKYTGELQNEKEAKDILNMLNRPAAKQLLLFHYKNQGNSQNNYTKDRIRYFHWGYNGDGSDPLRQQFLNDLANIGNYPKKCRNIAVANGNSGGIRKHAEGATQYSLNSSCFIYELKFNFYDLNRSDRLVSDINSKGNYRRRWYLYGLPALNGVPGGYRDDMNDVEDGLRTAIREQGCNNVTIPSPQQEFYSFVPTISALNIANANWDSKVTDFAEKNSPRRLGNTHFEAYYAPESASDEDHGEVTPENIAWLMKEIRFGEKRLEVNTGGVLAKSWNNPTQNGFVGSMDINAGGTLYLNANANLYDYTAPGSPTTVAGSTSHVRIGSACGSTKIINVNSGGKMILGDVSPSVPTNNKAHLYITDGAKVNINTGGELIVNPGSKLIVQKGGKLVINSSGAINPLDGGELVIEDGGELVYNAGANLNLSTYGSVLKIKGKLTIGDNADFTFSGNGKLVFDQDVRWITDGSGTYLNHDDYWDIGTNATFTVHGSTPVNYDRQLILAEKPVYMRMEDGTVFASVDIRNGRIALNEGALMGSFSPTQLHHVKVNGYYPSTSHSGFWLWNAGGTNLISNCKFEGGGYGLRLDWIGGGNAAIISNSTFEDNGRGVQILRGPLKAYNCDFSGNYKAIESHDAIGLSIINGCNLSSHNGSYATGVEIKTPQGGATFTIGNCDISNFYTGLSFENTTVTSYCTEYSASRNGAVEFVDGILDISSGAKNKFYSNANDIWFAGGTEVTGVLLDNGENDFEARGQSDAGLYFEGYVNQLPSNPIEANNNKIPTYTNQVAQTKLKALIYDQNGVVNNYNISPNLSSVPNCNGGSSSGSGHVAAYNAIQAFPTEGGAVSAEGGYSGTFRAGALDALQYVSSGENIYDDLLALQKINGLMLAGVSNPDSYTEKIKAHLYYHMHTSLSQAYQFGGLLNTENGATEVIEEVSDVISIIDERMSSYDPNDSTTFGVKFRSTLDKVHAYRVSGYYDLALSLLYNSSQWTFDNEQSMRAGYWQCACEAERSFFQEEIGPEDFGQVMDDCKQQYAGYTRKHSRAARGESNAIEQPLLKVENIYPQPVSKELTVELNFSTEKPVDYQISDVSGKVLQSGKEFGEDKKLHFNVSRLSVGVYFLSLDLNGKTEVVKFSKK